jgi:hypothetical protein
MPTGESLRAPKSPATLTAGMSANESLEPLGGQARKSEMEQFTSVSRRYRGRGGIAQKLRSSLGALWRRGLVARVGSPVRGVGGSH